MDFMLLGDLAAAGFVWPVVIAAALALGLVIGRVRRNRLEEALHAAERRATKERERVVVAERELESERARVVPLTEGQHHLFASLGRSFQELPGARDKPALLEALADTIDRVFDPSQFMVFGAADRDGREFHLAAAGGARGCPWTPGARLNDTMGRLGLVARRRTPMDRDQFDAEPPIVREQLAQTEPADFIVEVAVPVVVGGNVAAILSVGGSTLPPETTRGGLELLACHAAALLRTIEASARIERLKNTDDMTGLGSKGWLVAEGAEEVYRCRLEERPAALVVLGIDDFRGYVARSGHSAGDKLLKGVADAMRPLCDPGVFLARWSGAEFVALLPGANQREGHAFADSVRAAISAADWPNAKTQPRGRLTMSAGVAFLPASGSNLDELIESAAESLSSARWNGDATHSEVTGALLQDAATVEIEIVTPTPGSGPGQEA